MADVSFYDPQSEAEARRKRAFAELLMRQGEQPTQTEVVGGLAVPQSPIAGLAKALQTGLGGYFGGQADRAEAESAKKLQSLYGEAFASGDPKQAYQILAQDPRTAQLAGKLYGDVINAERQDKNWERETAFKREMDALNFAQQNQLLDRQQAAANARMAQQQKYDIELANLRNSVANGVDPNTGQPVYSNKPLPATALKMQNEAIDMLSAATNTQNLAKKWIDAVDKGEVRLGPIANLRNEYKNYVGDSDAASRNYASLDTDLEKLRNDTLRLNKGTQTEGDAERAMNEVIKNKNDPRLLKESMQKLQSINERAADLQKLQVENIRSNYNLEPFDFSKTVQPLNAENPVDKIRARLESKGMSKEQIDKFLKDNGL